MDGKSQILVCTSALANTRTSLHSGVVSFRIKIALSNVNIYHISADTDTPELFLNLPLRSSIWDLRFTFSKFQPRFVDQSWPPDRSG